MVSDGIGGIIELTLVMSHRLCKVAPDAML